MAATPAQVVIDRQAVWSIWAPIDDKPSTASPPSRRPRNYVAAALDGDNRGSR